MLSKTIDTIAGWVAGAAVTAGLGLGLVTAAPASAAPFGIVPGSFKADAVQADGTTPFTQAAGHPFSATTSLELNPGDTPDRTSGYLQNTMVKLPNGFLGNPEAAPKCSRKDFTALFSGNGACPEQSQVGIATIVSIFRGDPVPKTEQRPIYNVQPLPGQLADLATIIGYVVPIHLVPKLDPADGYALRVDVTKASEGVPVRAFSVTLWGVPGDPAHMSQRACGTNTLGGGLCVFVGEWAQKPFLINPSECAGPTSSSIAYDSWADPQTWLTDSYKSSAIDGCDQLRFDPSLDVATTTRAPDSPVGLQVSLGFPQNDDTQGIGTPPLRDATVTLPEGMTINPASAGGLAACSDAQLKLGTDDQLDCPEASQVGTVTATSPLLDAPLTGRVFIRSQNSDDPASGEMFRLALVLENKDRGLSIRLPGSIRADPSTGRLVTTFANNPQVPVSDIKLTFKGGSRAPLATPTTCGTKTIDADLTSWGGQTVHRASSFTVDCASGLGGFSPTLTAGTSRPVGGAFSPFNLSISKPDGNTDLTGLTMQLPTGLLAQLKGNLNTQVGTVKAFAGPGSDPFMLPGQVFLEGQYGDAPFSLRAVVPAVAGPFNLGTVTVRQKIYVDPIDAHVTVVSDPLPTIVKGVPVRLQRLDVSVDKPGFIINPTSCAAKTISATLGSATGQTAALSNRFQVGDCSALALKPSLALSLSGKGQTTDGKHPAVTANLTQPAGQANLKKVRVALPLSLALDTENANGLCEYVDGSKTTPTCPKNSIVGTATATTPILDELLSGPVYFVKNVRKDPKSGRDIRTLPKLVIPLVGQNGVKLTLTGTSDVEDDQLVTTFDNIPDAPVSSFKLSIIGGKGGILAVSGADICKATQVADQQINGQNNKQANTDVYIQTPSCPTKILSKTITKKTVALKIGGLGAGKVTITGHGIRKTTKTITKSTVATITAKRTKGKPGKVTVSFDPAGPAKARKATK